MIAGIKRKKINLFRIPACSGLIRKLTTGEYRLYSKTKIGNNIVLKNVGTYCSVATAKKNQQSL